MSKSGELRDPIHGFIQRSDIEQKLIDTSVFQRLRGIKQLSMANLVYPGALHTRFDHSIGVMHVAGRMAEKLEVDWEKLPNVRLSALLHDIGHGPFSHVSEDLLYKYYDKRRVKPKNNEKIHELLTCQIIESNKELSRIPFDREKVSGLILGTLDEPFVHGIISGPLDADKLDYLLRDSYFCGVKYGIYDIDRLIGTLLPQ
ncbi:MAG: HD domain-containing protein [bacterium]